MADENTNTPVELQPIGLEPRSIHNRKRLEAIKGAITRYINGGKQLPRDWIVEYNDLILNLNSQKN